MEEEKVWIQRALAGDQDAFACLVEAYQTAVYNLAYRMLGNAVEAEDAAQEAFLKAYTRLKTYDSGRKFSSWLLAIASHHCIDRLRQRRFALSLGEFEAVCKKCKTAYNRLICTIGKGEDRCIRCWGQ